MQRFAVTGMPVPVAVAGDGRMQVERVRRVLGGTAHTLWEHLMAVRDAAGRDALADVGRVHVLYSTLARRLPRIGQRTNPASRANRHTVQRAMARLASFGLVHGGRWERAVLPRGPAGTPTPVEVYTYVVCGVHEVRPSMDGPAYYTLPRACVAAIERHRGRGGARPGAGRPRKHGRAATTPAVAGPTIQTRTNHTTAFSGAGNQTRADSTTAVSGNSKPRRGIQKRTRVEIKTASLPGTEPKALMVLGSKELPAATGAPVAATVGTVLRGVSSFTRPETSTTMPTAPMPSYPTTPAMPARRAVSLTGWTFPEGPDDEPVGPRSAECWMPPMPTAARLGARHVLPPAPKLDPETASSHARELGRVWAGVLAARYGDVPAWLAHWRPAAVQSPGAPSWARQRATARPTKPGPNAGRATETLRVAAELLCALEVPPVVWCAWSVDHWRDKMTTSKEPPPLHFVFNADRITRLHGYAMRAGERYAGGRDLGMTPEHRALLVDWQAMQRDVVTHRGELTRAELRAIVHKHFPGNAFAERAAAAAESHRAEQERIAMRIARGDLVWL